MADIWMNFEKKDFKKGLDFKGQLIYEDKIETQGDPIFEFNQDKTITINFGFGYIKMTVRELIKELTK